MRKGVVRSAIVVASSLLVALLAQGVYVTGFCPQHQALVHARTGKRGIMLAHTFGVPRSGDVIFACESPHRIGSVTLHTDLVCYCGPRSSQEEISTLVGGPCEIDVLDRNGKPTSCSLGYCDKHWGL